MDDNGSDSSDLIDEPLNEDDVGGGDGTEVWIDAADADANEDEAGLKLASNGSRLLELAATARATPSR